MWLRPLRRCVTSDVNSVFRPSLSTPSLFPLFPRHLISKSRACRFANTMAPSKEEKQAATLKGNSKEDLEGEHNEWKFRAPYKVHDDAEDFRVLYEGGCHCGRVRYQLSRDKPLDAKYCHCTTCQTLHGKLDKWRSIRDH